MSSWKNDKEIEIFREYLRIPSVHPDIDYVHTRTSIFVAPVVEFLRKQAADLELPIEVYQPGSSSKPAVVITWVGEQPEQPTIMLNSHMDVVPVYSEKWTHPPFAADIDNDGRIFARGAQDMKCVGMQYLAAIRRLRKDGVTLKRTIHVTFIPDEEISGEMGMKAFLKSAEFKKLNVGFCLDEGIASANETFSVFYAERSLWHVHFLISGTSGHGSLLHKNTVGQKLQNILNKLMEFRQNEIDRLENDPSLRLGDVTTVNLTVIKGGVQSNVVPSTLEVVFDMRLALNVDHDNFDRQLRAWCEEAGGGIEIQYEQKEAKVEATKIDSSNLFWVAFEKATTELNLKIQPLVFPAGTDAVYIRDAGIPAIGFSPINNTPVLLHDHDEFLQADVYLKGIVIYKKIVSAIGNA
ncbi:PREDICTED: aminoacylase-1-like isoform X1 [Rhagoletis zephyria]|uniref:aminoacylase-1-like isoform X1 n=2 Tax=Rhagoletis zephyria TaxID=28612 RepID=UPI0008115C37|nr:PREDICTED: aminoacylase-1-like isoform X1 [Rhagoletis zephyria]XP_017486449.1 PREDICTED: aminoacylase-1-like isoform X1 [Rhagoletis zephyria]XP_017486450.1 PREDICTED: aminoacylase-1-like isoform X1 [Rhagoletis zephyria]